MAMTEQDLMNTEHINATYDYSLERIETMFMINDSAKYYLFERKIFWKRM